MSDINMQKVIKHLQEKWKGAKCPMCGEGAWGVQDTAFQLTQFAQGNLIVGGPIIPVIPVSCNNCGNTILVNAIQLGVVKQDEGKKNG